MRVLDRSGEPVRGLTAADFTLLDQGRPQTLAAVDAIELGGEAAPGAAALAFRRPRAAVICSSSTSRSRDPRRSSRRVGPPRSSSSTACATPTSPRSPRTRSRPASGCSSTFSSDRAALAEAIETLGLEPVERSDPLQMAYRERRTPGLASQESADQRTGSSAERRAGGPHRNRPDDGVPRPRAHRRVRAGTRPCVDPGPPRSRPGPRRRRRPQGRSCSFRRASEPPPRRRAGDVGGAGVDDQGRRLEGRCRPPLRQHRAAVGPLGHGRLPPAEPLRDPHGRHRRVRDRDRRRRARRAGRRASPHDPERPLRSLERDGRRGLPVDDRHRRRAPAARPPDEPRVRPRVPARPSRRGGQVPRAQGQGRPLRREGVVAPRILRETRLPAAHAARAEPLRGRHHRQRDPVLRHRAPCPGDALRGARPRGEARLSVVIEIPGGEFLQGEKGDRTTLEIYAYAFDGSQRLGDFLAEPLGLDVARASPQALHGRHSLLRRAAPAARRLSPAHAGAQREHGPDAV